MTIAIVQLEFSSVQLGYTKPVTCRQEKLLILPVGVSAERPGGWGMKHQRLGITKREYGVAKTSF